MLRKTWMAIFSACCISMFALVSTAGASADLLDAGEEGRVASAKELGFSGSVNEIRKDARSFALRGAWDDKDFRDYPEIKRMAEHRPLVLREFGPVAEAKTIGPRTEVPRKRDVIAEMSEEVAYAGGHVSLPDNEYPVTCRTSGRRVKLVYAYGEGYQPTEPWEALQLWTAMNRANAKILIESLRSSELERMVVPYVDCYPPGHPLAGWPTITVAAIPSSASTIPLGLRQVLPFPAGADSVRYLSFYSESDPAQRASGYAQPFSPDWRTSANAINGESSWAVVFRQYWFSHVVIHELFHTFGAVSKGSPAHWASTGYSHCIVSEDVMCYNDSGPRAHLYPIAVCPDNSPSGVSIDCLKSVYFRADHGDGRPGDEWLDEHWNVIGAENRFMHAYPPWDYSVPCLTC